jgi:hypothetical protein
MNTKAVFISIIVLAATITACGPSGQEELTEPALTHDAFFANLSTECGETFVGASTYPDNPDHPLVGTELKTVVSKCTETMVRIELIRGGDYWHGAWVIERRPEGLHLFHDHLGDVRTLEDLGDDDYHGYGGYATESGTDLRQFFAADDVTAEIIPEAVTNVWMMELDPENGRFIYYLERHEAPRFRAELERI